MMIKSWIVSKYFEIASDLRQFSSLTIPERQLATSESTSPIETSVDVASPSPLTNLFTLSVYQKTRSNTVLLM